MIGFLAIRNLRRSASRTLLLIAGVTIAGALLFDMSMLSGGLEASFADELGRLGYEIRVTLKGTLPLATEALIPRAAEVAQLIAADPDVAWTAPLLGTNLYVQTGTRWRTAFAMGMVPEIATIVRLPDGLPASGAVINPEMARAFGVSVGQPLHLANRLNPQTGGPERTWLVPVRAVGEFAFDLAGQRTIAVPLADLRALMGLNGGEASFVIVKLQPGADVAAAVSRFGARFPDLDTISVATLVQRVSAQLTYFNHFAVILSSVSLLVSLLLIGAVLTLGIGERLGEIATLRAIGVRRGRVVLLVLAEGALLAAICVPLGLLLGAAFSGPLDAILRSSPGLPQDLHFFVWSTAAAVRTAVLLLAAGTLGAAYPAWIAGRLSIAATLHREVQ